MLALLAASLLAASTSAAPAPPAAAPAPGQPLRQLTYKVTQGTRTYSGGEHYRGFSSSSSADADQGTVGVSVLSAASDVLQVSVTETMNSTGRPATYTGAVFPDGTLAFGSETITDVTRQLLVYFGTRFQPPGALGSGWDANYNRDGVDVTTHYGVVKLDGELLTLSVKQNVKIAAQNMSVALDGTIVMKPSLLVPVTGDLHRTIHRTSISGDTETRESLQFQRVADSLDPSAH